MTLVKVSHGLGSVQQQQWRGKAASRFNVWYSSTVVYQFYIDDALGGSGSAVSYVKSTDSGDTWGSGTSTGITLGILDMDIFYERWLDTAGNPIVHIVGHHDQGTDRGYKYVNMDLSTETLGSVVTVYNGGGTVTTRSGPLAVGVARNGDIHVTGAWGITGGTPIHKISTDGGASFSDSGDTSFGQSINDLVQLWPDASSADTADMLAIWNDASASTLYVTQYDSSAGSWGGNNVISASIEGSTEGITWSQWYGNISSAYRRSNGHIYVAAFAEQNNTTPNTLYVWDIYGTSSITARTNLLTNKAYANSVALQVTTDNRLVAVYGYDPDGLSFDGMRAYYSISSDAGVTWGTESLYLSEDMRVSAIFIDPCPNVDEMVPVIWKGSSGGTISAAETLVTEGHIDLVTPPTPSSDYPIVFKCGEVDGVSVITVTVDGVNTIDCLEVDGVGAITATVNSYAYGA